MAMPKTADAHLVHPSVSKTEWANIRVAGKGTRIASEALKDNLIERASSFFSKPFSPKDFLLSHATIIASVDSETPPDTKTGSLMVDSFKVDRRYPDYRITAGTQKYINNNKDAWNRQVLSMAYPTFVGAHNFVEHVQVEELSKGRIIDAVARDIGDSIYVDILIATDRMHKDLIKAIQNGKMGTLSMGCTVDGTICTKCGHWAADETEMCPHIKYQKGNTFFDEQGRRHLIAELCGHQDLTPTGGVAFVEGSWVGVPAFTGAVIRNVLEPTPEISLKASRVLATPPPQWSPDAQLRAASFGAVEQAAVAERDADLARAAARGAVEIPTSFKNPSVQKFRVGGDPGYSAEDDNAFFAGWMDDEGGGDEGGGEGGGEAPAEAKKPLEDIEQELEQHLLDRVKTRIKEKLQQEVVNDALEGESSTAPNDNVVKEAAASKVRTYLAGLDALTKTASSDVALVDALAAFNSRVGVRVPVPIYRAALEVGPHTKYSTVESFKSACTTVIGRAPTLQEAKTILRISKLLSRGRSSGGSKGSSRRRP